MGLTPEERLLHAIFSDKRPMTIGELLDALMQVPAGKRHLPVEVVQYQDNNWLGQVMTAAPYNDSLPLGDDNEFKIEIL